jgi:hypothetical protein
MREDAAIARHQRCRGFVAARFKAEDQLIVPAFPWPVRPELVEGRSFF